MLGHLWRRLIELFQIPNGKLAVGCTVGMVFTGKSYNDHVKAWVLRTITWVVWQNTDLFLAVLSIMLYIDEDYKIKMADTARKTTQEQIQKGEAGL